MSTGGTHRRVVDGRFELVERLGGGGMGLVWRAHDLVLQRAVAVKEVRHADPDLAEHDPAAAGVLRERVLREARALARVHHPNVVTIHHIVDGGEHTYPWIVMELVEGGSLQDRLERGVMSPVEAARMGREVLAALRAAHAVGIEHRDVKPANVLLRPDGRPVLTDFGIAAVRESAGLTATGSVIGSPDYMAPERVSGKEGGPAADLWSLAMLMYVAVEGHHPLRRGSTLATLAAVLSEDVPSPRSAGPLTAVLSALLVRDPQARPDAARVDLMLAAVTAAAPAPGVVFPSAPVPPAGAVVPPVPVPPAVRTPEPSTTSYPLTPPSAPPGVATVVPPADARPPARRGRGPAVAVAVLATALAGVLAWTLLPYLQDGGDSGGSGAASPLPGVSASQSARQAASGASGAASDDASGAASDDAPDPQKVDLLSGDGVKNVVAKLSAATGGAKVTSLVVYEEYAIAEVSVKGRPKLYDRYSYRGGDVAVKDGPGGTVMSGKVPVDLDVYDWDKVPGLLARAARSLGVPRPTSRYLLVDPGSTVFDTGPSMSVYLSDDYGSGYLRADVKGRVIATYPRDDG
ncbi:serine/threonine-protein kinase [Streptomyces sp. NBC_00199]|uniref:serine/threonine-protein kinase n=1 Tax=Streptomyces sp. NBC_00199 TaxID=2975678 RepID=UPI002253CFAC|nr:serine/threonine-protein kinase [Streptomyces sp. NBC_00199]MCX5262953.1 serine/threonine protein kinase [Streptomyces sp. NBC_00199]